MIRVYAVCLQEFICKTHSDKSLRCLLTGSSFKTHNDKGLRCLLKVIPMQNTHCLLTGISVQRNYSSEFHLAKNGVIHKKLYGWNSYWTKKGYHLIWSHEVSCQVIFAFTNL